MQKEGKKMPKIFQISKFAVRREDGSVKELPYGCYAYEFYSKCNYTIIGYKKEKLQGAIDREGNVIIPIMYSEKLEKILFNYNTIIKVIDERYVITEHNGKYDILDLEKMQVIYSALPDMKEIIKRLEEYEP